VAEGRRHPGNVILVRLSQPPLTITRLQLIHRAAPNSLLQSYLASPTSEAAHLVILIRGDAATCREHSRRIQAEKMAVVDLARTHDRGLQIVCLTDTECTSLSPSDMQKILG
jgi:hypothetical protein